MNKILLKNFLIIVSIASTVSACSKKESSDNFDLSNLKLPKKSSKIVKDTPQGSAKIKVENKLLIFKKREEILSSIKYGKNDPFSSKSGGNNELLNLNLRGFISTSEENFALVKYLGEEGTITTNSIGGVNTKYLPKGAKVKNFNLLDSEITILFDDKEFIISIKQ